MTLDPDPHGGSPPAWLPGGRRGESARDWWRDLVRAVNALVERYPLALSDVPPEWWRTADLAEQLGAVCAWRLDLDGGRSADPREELAFHEALERLRERVERRARFNLLSPAKAGEPTHRVGIAEGALEQDLRALADAPDVSLEESYLAPNDGRPGATSAPSCQPREQSPGGALGRGVRC